MSYVYGNLETDLAAAKKPRHSIASQAVILRLRRRFPVKQKSNKKIPDFDYVKKKKKILIDYDLTRWRKQILQFSHFSYIQPIRLKLQCTIAVSYSNIEKKEKDCYNFIFLISSEFFLEIYNSEKRISFKLNIIEYILEKGDGMIQVLYPLMSFNLDTVK